MIDVPMFEEMSDEQFATLLVRMVDEAARREMLYVVGNPVDRPVERTWAERSMTDDKIVVWLARDEDEFAYPPGSAEALEASGAPAMDVLEQYAREMNERLDRERAERANEALERIRQRHLKGETE